MEPITQNQTENNLQGLDLLISIIKENKGNLFSHKAVVDIRPGYSKSGNPESPEPVIFLILNPDINADNLPAEINGIRIETELASPLFLLNREANALSMWENAPVMEAAPHINYVEPPESEVSLKEVMIRKITCHAGPDSGWTTLKPFLEATETSLTVAMYEFYAQHIIETITELGEQGDASLKMILQVDKNDLDIEDSLTDSWDDRLEFVKASVKGPNRIFNNSYHTKVAVRDSKAFWLSSGNWSPNSQPLIESPDSQFLYREGNREWHIIVEDKPLAEMYEKFILYDMRMAKDIVVPEDAEFLPDLFIPVTLMEAEAGVIQPAPFEAKTFTVNEPGIKAEPLMSPDNYAREILKLIESAETSVFLQFSYIRQPSTEIFDDIIDAISQKMEDGLDVRVIVGPNQNAAHSDLLIAKRKWKRKMFRRQTSKVHNKGILVDGKIAVVGSNNWSSDGTQYNRDTSLVIHSPEVTAYFTKIFNFDWTNLTKPIASAPEITPLIAPENAPAPPGMERVSWKEWYD